MTRTISLALVALLALGLGCAAGRARPDRTPLPAGLDRLYLFSYFKEGERKDGKKIAGGIGLWLAWSADGLDWRQIGHRRVFEPTLSSMVRDPFICRGPDGAFRLVWTTGWNEKSIGYAASDDLIHWRDEALVPVMANEPTTLNTWAPECTYDDASQNFIIYWSSTIPGRFPETEAGGDGVFGGGNAKYNHRIYSTATADWKTFTPARVLIDPGVSCIDADIFKWQDGYAMVLKIEALKPPAKWLVVSRAPSASGPWGPVSEPITRPGDWSEGPSTIVIDGRARVYFDRYVARRYGAVTSPDLKTWTYVDDLKMPRGVKHGNAFAVETPVVAGVVKAMGK